MRGLGFSTAVVALAGTVALTSAAAAQDAASEAVAKADAIYRNGFVYTADAFRSTAQAIAVRDGTFFRIGTNEDMDAVIGPETQVIDLQGGMVMPGIVDSHIHPVRGGLGQLFFCNFPVESTVEQILDTVKDCVANADQGAWVEGKTWDSSLSSDLTAAMLDEIAPDNPVYLHDDTNHLGWVNSAALTAAEITKDTLDPAGGEIGRDDGGEPTGVLFDSAAALIVKAMPAPLEENVRAAAEWIFQKLNTYGVTGARLAQLDETRLAAYRAMEEDGVLTVRLQGSWDFNTRYATVPIEEMAERFATREARGPVSHLINPDGVKIYADGVWIGYGSPMIDMYETGQTFGRQSIDQPSMKTWVTRFDAEGLSVMIHAVGDQAVRNALNAVEAARRTNGPDGPRHHIAHNSFVHAEDLDRARDLNIIAEVSPANTWYPSSYLPSFAELLGRDRVSQMVPVGKLVGNGAIVAYGSDWDNVPEPDPWLALQTLVTRTNPDQPELGVIGPEMRVDLPTAIEILTINGAHALGLEAVTGSIEPGKEADFIVLNQNLFDVPIEKVVETEVLRTVLRGRTVHMPE